VPATGGAIAGSGAGSTTTVGYTVATARSRIEEGGRCLGRADVPDRQQPRRLRHRGSAWQANDDEFDFAASDALNPQKAPILLMLALTRLAIHARSSASSGPIEQNMEGAEPLARASHR
jgi:L-asparaginase/Glu-tRNA(Gln) amidotransferase subunit D